MAVYKVIREHIIENILSGVYMPHDMIETQEYFSKKFGVSRITIRKAFNELIDKKILYSVQGKGTFVGTTNLNKVKTLRKISFSDSERSATNKFSSKLIRCETLVADLKLAKQLKIEVGSEVQCIVRVRMVNNFPENYQMSYIPKNLIESLEFTTEELETKSLFEKLKNEATLIPHYSDEEVRAVNCPSEICDELLLDEEEPLLFVKRHTYTKDNTIMEYCEDYESSTIKGLKIRTYANWAKQQGTK